MKKYLTLAFILLFAILAPSLTFAETYDPDQGLVPCGQTAGNMCTLCDFFKMLAIVYDFLVKWIASPLAVLALSVGGVFMMVSAGNPGLQNRGRQIVMVAVIGLALVWGSWLIIDFVVKGLGYKGDWSTIQCS